LKEGKYKATLAIEAELLRAVRLCPHHTQTVGENIGASPLTMGYNAFSKHENADKATP
jgi:hypothetical protein